ncbi:MAG: hypothetical protein HOG92_07055 [Methylococcales bacterium]|jgi:hypothetical protein|nr:hypothetical protein [Methylococcales bacterium]MBT3698362.1 hypothetical protein [Methylococcales bacterium]MBT3815450.1 hypothetical protein [Methylococcales bacterium]MBT4032916.1 hypothetical protein [Methylococcales bacterium]MBT4348674.1 hypothetical protein [Methylococcales bacterium]
MKTRVQKFIDRMDSQEYILTKDIGNYIIYSFLEIHREGVPNIMSQTEFSETILRLLENWDDLPQHKDKYLLRKDFLLIGECLPYDEMVYPELVRNLAISWSASLLSEVIH